MPAASYTYGLAVTSLFSKQIDWEGDTVVAILLDNTYIPDRTTHRYMSSLTGELTDPSYARATIAGKSISFNPVSNATTLDCEDIIFPDLVATNVRYAVWAVSTGTASTSPLLCYWDFGVNLNPTLNDLRLTINSAGLMVFSVS